MREAGATLVAGLTLAIVSSAAINLGYLIQHRGLREVTPTGGGRVALLRASFHSRRWLAGQGLGITGFAVQVAAVAIAPLSLVQAFAAGGLALSVPFASRLFGHRVRRGEALAVVAMAVALASLPLGLPDNRERLHEAIFYVTMLPVFAVGIALVWRGSPILQAVGAGLSYGVADAAVKAISVRWGADGASALLTAFSLQFVLGTAAGFVGLQGALRGAGAVNAISLMTAFATLVSVAAGLAAFGESFGTNAATVTLHAVAIAVVLICVRPLAAAQAELETLAPG